ncbi:MAG: hypothetical protein LBB25_04275, partial [Holosporaceae bacterium]|nr:hypothetical protein [Holosporaceae bacterium]
MMKSFFIATSGIMLLIQCCQVESMHYGDSVTSESVSADKVSYNIRTPEECFISWNRYFDQNKDIIDEEGTFADKKYVSDTIRIIKGISILKSCQKCLANKNNPAYLKGIEGFQKPINSQSSLRRLAVHLVFFDLREVNEEIAKRLKADQTINQIKSMDKRISNTLLEFVRMVSLISQIDITDRNKGESYFNSDILKEIEPEMKFVLEYINNPTRKEEIRNEMAKRTAVGEDKDNIVRAIIIMTNALLYSDVNNDNANGLYAEFIKAFPALRIGEWILKYCYLNKFKMDIGTHVAALASINDRARYKSDLYFEQYQKESNAFADAAASTLETFDSQQAIRIIKNVTSIENKRKILDNIIFDGQSASTQEVVDRKAYIKDLFSFIDLWHYYAKEDCLQNVDRLLKRTKIKLIDKEVLENMQEYMYPMINDYLQSSNHQVQIDANVALSFLDAHLSIMKKRSKNIDYENYIVNITHLIDFSNIANKDLEEFISKICVFPFQAVDDVNITIMKIIAKEKGRKITKDFALKLMHNNKFQTCPELIEFVDDFTNDPLGLIKVLLQIADNIQEKNVRYSIMAAIQKIFSNNHILIPYEDVWKIILLARSADYTAPEFVFLADKFCQKATELSLEYANILIECTSGSVLTSIINKINLEDKTTAQMDKKIYQNLIKNLPEEYLDLVLDKLDFANDLDNIVEALYYKFRNSRNIPRNLYLWHHVFGKIIATGKISPKTQGILNAFMKEDPLYAEDYLDFIETYLKIELVPADDKVFPYKRKKYSYKVGRKELQAPHKEMLLHALLECPLSLKQIHHMTGCDKIFKVACMLMDYLYSTSHRIISFKEYAALVNNFYLPVEEQLKNELLSLLIKRLDIALDSKIPYNHLRQYVAAEITKAKKDYETKGKKALDMREANRENDEYLMQAVLAHSEFAFGLEEEIVVPERIVMDMKKTLQEMLNPLQARIEDALSNKNAAAKLP